jgi:S-layer protein
MSITVAMRTQVSQLYVSLFGRAPDGEGLGYWVGQLAGGKTVAQVAQDMFNVTAARAYYPSFMTNDEIVAAFYVNVLGRTADAEGQAYWVGKMNATGATKGSVIADMINAVVNYTGTDAAGVKSKALFTNKVEVAQYYGEKNGTVAGATAALAGVTEVAATVTAGKAAVDAGANPGQTFMLTAGIDSGAAFTGGAGNDTFNAISTGFSAGDVLNGGAGQDTLTITDNVAGMGIAAPSATLTSIEGLTISTNGGVGVSAVTAVPATAAVKEVDTLTIAGTTGPDTYTVVFNGVTLSTSGVLADDAAAATAIAALINAAAGETLATAINANVVIHAATAGVALPGYTVTNNDESGNAGAAFDITPVDSVANAAAVAAVTGVTAAAYDVSSFTSLTDNTVTAAGAINLKSSATANVSATTTSGKVTLDGGLTQKAVAVGGYAISGGKGAITVTDTAQGAVNSTVDGGTSVTVVSTAKNAGGTTGTITVGGTTKPTGDINITSTISEAKGTTNTAAGAIAISGGANVVVTQTATKALQTTAAANGTITNAAVTVTGDTATTSVTAKASEAVTAANTVLAVAAVTEVNTLTFAALTAGQTQILNGLTFTAGAAGTTAAQTAAAFANLTSGDAQGNSKLGTYSGSFTAGWTSGPVTGTSTVAFTGTTAAAKTNLADTGTGTDPTVVVTTDGVDAVEAAGKVGVTANTVTITDVNNGSATKAGTITTATAENYTTFTFNGNSLSTLNLKGGSGDITIANGGLTTATNKTLALTVDGLTGGTLDDADIYTTLNVTTKYTGSSTTTSSTLADITNTALTALNVGGDKVLVLTSTAGASALVDVAVTGSAGLTATFAATTMKTINTSGTTGTATITFDATKATYTGGAGKDVVTTSATAPTKAISLGGGDDSLTLASGTTAVTGAISGGEGTDTLSMVVADAATADNDLAFSALVTGFEELTLTGSTGAQGVVLSNLGLTNKVTVATGAGTTTLTDLANAGTLTLTGDRAGDTIVISNTAFSTPTTDSINIVQTATAGFDGGTVSAANVETVNLTATDSSGAVTAHTLVVTADKATTLNVSGNAGVTLTLTSSALLATLDATASTGAVSATSVSTAAMTMKGGSGKDAFTAKTGTNADVLIGNGGDDTLTSNAGLTTLTGGDGNDTFVVATNTANIGTYTTITDFTAGDLLKLANKGTESFTSTKLSLADTATFQDYLNLAAAGDGSTNGIISWFQFGGNTFVVEDMTAGASYTVASDLVVKLTGLVDLSVASLNTGSGPTISL